MYICVEDSEGIQPTGERSNKVFYNANGSRTLAGERAILPFQLWEPANQAEIVPGLAMNLLLSTRKCADANYITLFTPEEVKIFDVETTRINIDGEAILHGWQCPQTKLWRVPLMKMLSNLKTDTALLTKEAMNALMKLRGESDPKEYANNVYELPSTEKVVCW